jgi:hypothetical protein
MTPCIDFIVDARGGVDDSERCAAQASNEETDSRDTFLTEPVIVGDEKIGFSRDRAG